MTPTVVMKFGGTSVGSSERIGMIAKRVAKIVRDKQARVVVVVSAMSGETDRLIELGRKVGGALSKDREYHQLVTAGEHASIALTAMAIQREGIDSKSLLAQHIRLKTHSIYGQHIIESIDASVLTKLLDKGCIPVVAGFQGIDDSGDYTTLGRGGSDTTAVALAAALSQSIGEDVTCEILTDVDGVYTALPSICKKARKLDSLTYEEMLEFAGSGAKVLQSRSVSLARKHKVPLVVRSSFNGGEGTKIVEEYEAMEDAVVSGISSQTDEARFTLRNLPNQPGIAAKLFNALSTAGVVVDMIVQSYGGSEVAALSFTVPRESADATFEVLVKLVNKNMPQAQIEFDKDIAKLSVVGEGMRTHAGVAAKMFEVLGAEGINIQMITTSEIKISVAIEAKYSELAVRVLHEHFVENPNWNYSGDQESQEQLDGASAQKSTG